MSEAESQSQFAGRIEGGIDAIVVGAGFDGLVAAAYLGRAGLKTILLGASAEIGGGVKERTFESGLKYPDGEHLVSQLDPVMIEDLDLYRFGLSYAARRLDTVYFFEDGRSLHLSGDLHRAGGGALEDEEDAAAFQKFMDEALEAAAFLRPAFEPAGGDAKAFDKLVRAAPAGMLGRINQYLMASADDVFDAALPDGLFKTAMISEAAFRAGAAPNEPFSFMDLLRRWSGEVSGLQGALAFPEGGAPAIVDALRRAAQAARVDIREAAPVSTILIEKDRAAGVELENGGQLRAPLVIAACNAERVFNDFIGPAELDLEFQRAVQTPPPVIASADIHIALSGVAKDEKTLANMRRRLVYAPAAARVRRAFAAARAGEIPEDLIIETVFPGALDENLASDQLHTLSAIAHPLPFDLAPDDRRRDAIRQAVFQNLEKFAPEITGRIEETVLSLPVDRAEAAGEKPSVFAAPPGFLRQAALARAAASGGNIGGFYFCGPEAQIGSGLSGLAGRIAAKRALKEARRGAFS